jgi:hypothetical protein
LGDGGEADGETKDCGDEVLFHVGLLLGWFFSLAGSRSRLFLRRG